jgi:hypothetical protein
MSQQRRLPKFQLPWEIPHPEIPDPQSDTNNWLTVTDNLCKIRFDPSQPLPPDYHRAMTESAFADSTNQNVLQEIVGARRLACTAHLQLSRTVTILFTEGDFENKWLALGKEQQERHLLNAFKIHESNPGESAFMYGLPEKLNCPELCRDFLLKDGGRGFLDLLKVFLLDNNDEPPTQPFIAPNARFDAIIGWKGDDDDRPNLKAWLSMRRMLRTRRIRKIHFSFIKL